MTRNERAPNPTAHAYGKMSIIGANVHRDFKRSTAIVRILTNARVIMIAKRSVTIPWGTIRVNAPLDTPLFRRYTTNAYTLITSPVWMSAI